MNSTTIPSRYVTMSLTTSLALSPMDSAAVGGGHLYSTYTNPLILGIRLTVLLTEREREAETITEDLIFQAPNIYVTSKTRESESGESLRSGPKASPYGESNLGHLGESQIS